MSGQPNPLPNAHVGVFDDHPTGPDILFRSAEEVGALQDRLLQATMALCERAHPSYRALMRASGLTASQFRTTLDLQMLPITDKAAFLRDPEAFRLETDGLPVEAGTIREVMYTTGSTTGRPAPIYTSTADYNAYLVQAKRGAGLLGLRTEDLIANVFPLTSFPSGGYVRANATAAAVGAALLVAHPGRPTDGYPVHRTTEEVVRLIETHRATIVWGIASFVRRLLLRAAEISADLSSVRACWITGEPVSPARREDMKARLRALGSAEAGVVNRYGSTEGTTLVECVEGAGWHNPAPDQIFLEVVDPETERRLPDEEPGLLLVTHLLRTGTVLLRYALGDIVAIDHSACPQCGRTSERVITQPVRTGDVIKVKGALVSAEAMRGVLERAPGIAEYQIVLQRAQPADPFSSDQVLLRLAASAGTDREAIGREVEARFVRRTNVRPVIEWTTPDQIFDPSTDPKATRFIDSRADAEPESADAEPDPAGGE
jgi:phenylacetate-coenzyme A ligase PaaK-like adenylate-forming protein